MSEPGSSAPPPPSRPRSGALSVGAGILTSRIAGLARAAATSAAFGVGPYADVFQTALRAPNILQNLLGEQALSASFIPVYSRFLARGEQEAARRFAGAIFGLLVAVAGGLALLGVIAARPLVALFAAGYLQDAAAVAAGSATIDRFELAVRAVRWIFPMTGLLVLSAWALGVLNSHRRFFLPYVAPVAWNAAIVAALWLASGGSFDGGHGGGAGERLLFAACIGALLGGALQFAVQVPAVLRELGGLRPTLSRAVPGVREALAAFAPALAGRGVVQVSSFLDQVLASLLAVGAVSALGYAQMLYLLPVSLFGQAIAAAALPELSRSAVTSEGAIAPRARRSLGDAELLHLPVTVALIGFAPVAVAGLYQLLSGRFGDDDVALVAAVLSVYALGLPASIASRVLQSSFFALGDTRTPARIAALRVALGAAVAVPAMIALDRFGVERLPFASLAGGSDLRLGALGLALGASVAAWLERVLLGRRLAARIGEFAPPPGETARRVAAAALAAVPAWGLSLVSAGWHPSIRAVVVLGALVVGYLALARALGVPGVDRVVGLLRRR